MRGSRHWVVALLAICVMLVGVPAGAEPERAEASGVVGSALATSLEAFDSEGNRVATVFLIAHEGIDGRDLESLRGVAFVLCRLSCVLGTPTLDSLVVDVDGSGSMEATDPVFDRITLSWEPGSHRPLRDAAGCRTAYLDSEGNEWEAGIEHGFLSPLTGSWGRSPTGRLGAWSLRSDTFMGDCSGVARHALVWRVSVDHA